VRSCSQKPHYWYGIFLMLTEENYKASAEELDAALRVDANYMPPDFQVGHPAALFRSEPRPRRRFLSCLEE
jgi:hypothetical protein